MSKKSLVSIIMPAYNTEKYIRQAMESVLQQTYEDWELIVINDGSSDKTEEVAREIAAGDKRIRIISVPNSGEASARNLGLDNARGDAVTFLDSDDRWNGFFLEKMNRAMMNRDADFVYCYAIEVTLDGKEICRDYPDIAEGGLATFCTSFGEFQPRWNMNSFLAKRDFLEQYHIRFDPEVRMSPDIGFFLKILAVRKAYCMPESLTYYCRRENSLTTRAWSPERWKTTVELYQYVDVFYQKYAPEELPLLRFVWSYRAYRFVWIMIKQGYKYECISYIDKWMPLLRAFLYSKGKVVDKIKCRLIMKKNFFMLGILRRIG